MPADADLHEVTTDEELDRMVEQTLADANIDLAELRRQAHEGRFQSEKLRRAWFAIGGLVRRLT
jgi:hypothetical protein